MKMGDEKNKGVAAKNYFVSTRIINIIRSKIFYLVGWYFWFVCTSETSEVFSGLSRMVWYPTKQENTLTHMSNHTVLNYLQNKKK